MDPFITVIVPTYNRLNLLKEALDSIRSQKFESWEAIIVDDGSKPKSESLVLDYKDNRMRYYYKDNGGLASARNFGLERAKGKYICFLDDDDMYMKDLFQQVHVHAAGDEILVFAYEMREKSGKLIRIVIPNTHNNFVNQYIELSYSPIPFFYPREFLTDARFDESDVVYEDVPFILPLITRHNLKCIENVSCIVRTHKERITGTKYRKHKSIMYSQVKENICDVIENLKDDLSYSQGERINIIYSKYDELLKGLAQVDWKYMNTIKHQVQLDYDEYSPPGNLDLRIKWIKGQLKKLFNR